MLARDLKVERQMGFEWRSDVTFDLASRDGQVDHAPCTGHRVTGKFNRNTRMDAFSFSWLHHSMKAAVDRYDVSNSPSCISSARVKGIGYFSVKHALQY